MTGRPRKDLFNSMAIVESRAAYIAMARVNIDLARKARLEQEGGR